MLVYFTSATKPLLSPHVSVSRCDGEIRVESRVKQYAFADPEARVLIDLRDRLDGTTTITALAARSGVSAEQLAAILGVLAEDNLVLDAEAMLNAESTDDFLTCYSRECNFWNGELLSQPFWSRLLQGQTPREVVLGWGIEIYQYVASANEHMAAAVAHFQGPLTLRRQLADHYVEERQHHQIFLEGLVRCGLDEKLVAEARPLAATRALINYLNELATSDTYGYAATFGVMQATEGTRDMAGAQAFYTALGEWYPFASPLFDALLKHTLIDFEASHHELLVNKMCLSAGKLHPDMRRRMVEAVRSVSEFFILLHEEIEEYYTSPGAEFPRRRFDIWAAV